MSGRASGSAVEALAEERLQYLTELHGAACPGCDGTGQEKDPRGDGRGWRACAGCGGRGRRGGMAEAMRALAASIDDLGANADSASVDCGVCGWIEGDGGPHADWCPAVVLARLRASVRFTPLADGQ